MLRRFVWIFIPFLLIGMVIGTFGMLNSSSNVPPIETKTLEEIEQELDSLMKEFNEQEKKIEEKLQEKISLNRKRLKKLKRKKRKKRVVRKRKSQRKTRRKRKRKFRRYRVYYDVFGMKFYTGKIIRKRVR